VSGNCCVLDFRRGEHPGYRNTPNTWDLGFWEEVGLVDEYFTIISENFLQKNILPMWMLERWQNKENASYPCLILGQEPGLI
jgi:hypothetical protein